MEKEEAVVINCFCDGSFKRDHNLGVVGWLIAGHPIQHAVIFAQTSSECEYMAMYNLLTSIKKFCDDTWGYTLQRNIVFRIHCDSFEILNNICSNRQYRKSSQLIRERTHAIEQLERQIPHAIEYVKIKGHSLRDECNISRYFYQVDEFVNKRAKEIIRSLGV